MGLHSAFGDKEFLTDLAIRPSQHERCQDLHLPRREGRSEDGRAELVWGKHRPYLPRCGAKETGHSPVCAGAEEEESLPDVKAHLTTIERRETWSPIGREQQ
jgi:hypothetical protein